MGKDEKFTEVDTTPTEPAIKRLLGQAETMELILLNLPMRDLLLSTKVCRAFRNVIRGSMRLQRALFFKPVAGGRLCSLIPSSCCGLQSSKATSHTSNGVPMIGGCTREA
jgi:hypothetical protein